MKTVCVYHSIDLDGWMSAAIVKHWFITNAVKNLLDINISNPNTIDFIGYNYGQPIPDLSEYDKVIMCDISFPKEVMTQLAQEKEFIWIDHHISAIKDNANIIDLAQCEGASINYSLNPKFAACELTWLFFFNETMPEIVRLLGRYDCFGHKGTDEEQKVLEFQYGARQEIWNYERAYMHLIAEIGGNAHGIEDMKEEGKAIYAYLCTEAKQAYKNGFGISLPNVTIPEEEYVFICINKERFNPINFGIDYHKDGYDGCACFHYANGVWNFSLYNDNGLVDCSVIAKQFGGGGHKGAAGFIIDNIYKIIK